MSESESKYPEYFVLIEVLSQTARAIIELPRPSDEEVSACSCMRFVKQSERPSLKIIFQCSSVMFGLLRLPLPEPGLEHGNRDR